MINKYNENIPSEILFRYENLSSPALILDNTGTVIYKNKLAYSYKLFRIGTSFCKYIDSESRYAFELCLTEKEPMVFPLVPNINASFAAVFFDSCGFYVANIILNPVLMHTMLSTHDINGELVFHKLNTNTANMFAEFCKNAGKTCGPSINELIIQNTQRLIRAEHHFELYLNSTKRTNGNVRLGFSRINADKNTASQECFLLSDFLRTLYNFAQEKCAALGYRLSFKQLTTSSVLCTDKQALLSVFFSIITLSLRCATDYKANVFLDKTDKNAIISFRFKSNIAKEIEARFKPDLSFISDIAEFNDWYFSSIEALETDYVTIKLCLPLAREEDFETTLNSYNPPAESIDEFANLAIIELSVLDKNNEFL